MMSWTCIPSGDWLNPVALTIGAVHSLLPNFSFATVDERVLAIRTLIRWIAQNTERYIFRNHIATGYNTSNEMPFCNEIVMSNVMGLKKWSCMSRLCSFRNKCYSFKGTKRNNLLLCNNILIDYANVSTLLIRLDGGFTASLLFDGVDARVHVRKIWRACRRGFVGSRLVARLDCHQLVRRVILSLTRNSPSRRHPRESCLDVRFSSRARGRDLL